MPEWLTIGAGHEKHATLRRAKTGTALERQENAGRQFRPESPQESREILSNGGFFGQKFAALEKLRASFRKLRDAFLQISDSCAQIAESF